MWKTLRDYFFPAAPSSEIYAEVQGRVLHTYYPLSTGEVVHKQQIFPDELMAAQGHQRFLQDGADRRPGHAERRYLRSVRLNNELIAKSTLNWAPSKGDGRGPSSLS